MARIAVIADIHGNYQALKAVLIDTEKQFIDRIIVAGVEGNHIPRQDNHKSHPPRSGLLNS